MPSEIREWMNAAAKLLTEAETTGTDRMYLIHSGTFERCQKDDPPMTMADGEAGHGVYCYPIRYAGKMQPYYRSNGERVFRLTMRHGASMVDLTRHSLMADLLAFARDVFARHKAHDAHYRVPRVSADSIERYGSIIQQFVRLRFQDVAGYIVPHIGPGLPTGKQAVIIRPDQFEVVEMGSAGRHL